MKKKIIVLSVTLLAFCQTPFVFAQEEAGGAAPKPAPLNKKYETEVNALVKKPGVKKAFQAIVDMEPQTRQEHILLNEIPAPPFKEDARGKQYAQMLKTAGADSVWIDEVGNVIGKRKGRSGKRTVVIEGHLDTVFPEGTDVKVKQKGDTLKAPGMGDDTRALAVVLTILRSMEKANLETDADVLFIGTVGEEGLGDLRGVKHLFRDNGPRIDSYIAIDGWSTDRVTHRGLGSHRYRVTYKGPGGHSSGAFGLANPQLGVGSTNSNIPISKGVPAVTIGSGGAGGDAHALTEWWMNDKGHIAIQQALLVLLAEAGLAK